MPVRQVSYFLALTQFLDRIVHYAQRILRQLGPRLVNVMLCRRIDRKTI